jgi:tetratricopeptide (TPR) repeat protein
VFEALVKAPAFGVPAKDLAKLRAFGDDSFDALLSEVEVVHDAEGRSVRRSRFVYRLNHDGVVQNAGTREFEYAAWHEARPELKVRIVSRSGEETWLDPTTISERVGRVDGLVIDDHRTLVAPLPGLGAGAIVEELLITTETRASFPGAPQSSRHHFGTHPYFQRLVVSAPGKLEHAVAHWDGPMPQLSNSGGKSTLTVERRRVGEPGRHDVAPFLEWSLGGTWQGAAAAYAAQIKAPSEGKPPAELTKKGLAVDGVMKAVAGKMRYTGLALGEASVVPYAPADVWKRAYGDCKDVSLLVVKSLEAQGIKASLALLRTGFGDDVLPGIVGLNRFNHAIVYVHPHAGQPARWIDTTAPELAPGTLPAATLERWALVIDGATTGLIKTPGRAEQVDRMHAETRIEGVPMGSAKVTEKVRWEGAIAGHNEPRHRGLDDKKLRAELVWLSSRFEAKEPSAVKVEGGPGQASLAVSSTFESAKYELGYDDGTWLLDVYAHLVDFAPEAVVEAQEHGAHRQSRKRVLSHTLRVVPPAGFVVRGDHLEDRDIRLGPATWSERFVREGKELVVTATLDLGALDWTAEQSKAFSESWGEFARSDMTSVRLVEEASDHFERGELKEALAVLRARLAKNKKDADARARLAYLTSQMGLTELARSEAELAVKDDPKGDLVLFAELLVRLRNTRGEEYGDGFDRARAIVMGRALVARDPKALSYRYATGRALVLNAKGQPGKGPEREEGKALLKGLALEGHTDSMALWAMATAQDGQWRELAETMPKLKGFESASMFHVVGVAGMSGAEALRKALPTIVIDRAAHGEHVEAAVSFLIMARDYDAARAISGAFARDFPRLSKQRQLIAKATRIPFDDDFSSPESGVGSYLTRYITNPEAFDEDGLDGGKTNAGLAALTKVLGGGGLAFAIDLVWGLSERNVDGSDELGWRAELVDTSGHFGANMTTFWKKAGKGYKMVEEAPGAGLGLEVLERLKRGDVDGARVWIGWFFDTLVGPNAETWKSRWPDLSKLSASELELVAACAAIMTTSPKDIGIEVMRKRLGEVPRPIRLFAYIAIVAHARTKGDFKGLADLWKTVPGSLEPERAEWNALLALHNSAKDTESALRLIDEQLKRAPNNPEWMLERADQLNMQGKLAEAEATYAELRRNGRLAGRGMNHYAWLQVVTDKVDDGTVAMARAAVAEAAKESRSKRAAQNTLAMVHLQRDELSEALTAFRASLARSGKLNDADELFMARFAQKLGFTSWAKGKYQAIASKKDGDATSVPTLAAKYLAAM